MFGVITKNQKAAHGEGGIERDLRLILLYFPGNGSIDLSIILVSTDINPQFFLSKTVLYLNLYQQNILPKMSLAIVI